MDELKFKRRFVVSMLHLLIGVTLGFGILAVIIQFILSLFGVIDLTLHEWPISVSTMAYDAMASDIEINGGLIQLTNTDWSFYKLIGSGLYFLKMTLGLAFLFHLRHVIASVEYGTPFSLENYQRLKYMAVILVFVFLANWLNSAVHQWYIINYVQLSSGEFINQFYHLFISSEVIKLLPTQILLDNRHSVAQLFGAVYIYSLAIVFKEGLRLKQDNDSIL